MKVSIIKNRVLVLSSANCQTETCLIHQVDLTANCLWKRRNEKPVRLEKCLYPERACGVCVKTHTSLRLYSWHKTTHILIVHVDVLKHFV